MGWQDYRNFTWNSVLVEYNYRIIHKHRHRIINITAQRVCIIMAICNRRHGLMNVPSVHSTIFLFLNFKVPWKIKTRIKKRHNKLHSRERFYLAYKKRMFCTVNAEAELRNNNGKVKILHSQFPQWLFHEPTFKDWTRLHITSSCSHNRIQHTCYQLYLKHGGGPLVAPIQQWQPNYKQNEQIRPDVNSTNRILKQFRCLKHICPFSISIYL